MNRSNRVLGWVKLSQGGLLGTVVDIRHVISIALKANSSFIVVVPIVPRKLLSHMIKN
jgi:DNA repair protein RadC